MKNIILATLIALTAFVAPVFAADQGSGGGNFLLTLFIGFFALIIVFQLVPAVIMLVGMVRGLLGRDQKKIETHS